MRARRGPATVVDTMRGQILHAMREGFLVDAHERADALDVFNRPFAYAASRTGAGPVVGGAGLAGLLAA